MTSSAFLSQSLLPEAIEVAGARLSVRLGAETKFRAFLQNRKIQFHEFFLFFASCNSDLGAGLEGSEVLLSFFEVAEAESVFRILEDDTEADGVKMFDVREAAVEPLIDDTAEDILSSRIEYGFDEAIFFFIFM